MSREVDDFLFPSAAPAAAASPMQTEELPQVNAPKKPPAASANKAPVGFAPPPLTPREVAMPRAEEVVPQVAAAASAAKAAAPEITLKSPVKSLSDEIFDNWKPFAVGAATLLAAQVAGSALRRRSVSQPAGGTGTAGGRGGPASPAPAGGAPTTNRVEPTFATPQETAAHEAEIASRNQQAQQRLEEFERMWAGRNAQTPTPAAPSTELVPNPNRTSPWDPEMIEVPVSASAATPEVPAIAEEAPKTAVALETNQPGNQVAEAVVKDELAKPAEAPKVSGAAEPPVAEQGVAARTRRTKAQIEADLAQAFANAPPGMRPSAPAKTNKLPGDVIGQGGWHFFAGQGGDPEEWLRFYGRQPQPYNRVVTDIKGGLLKVPPPAPGALGGTVSRQPYVPEFIRGRASPGGLTGVAAIAAALGLAGSEKGREAMGRAAAAIKDLGISPDIFQGKGEELGRLGSGYVTAGNPAYLRELNAQLKTERDPQRRAVLEEEIRKAGGQ